MFRHALLLGAAISVVLSASALAGCSPDLGDAPTPSRTADQQQGERLAQISGCMACHAPGGSATSFVGLAGTTVRLADGSSVIADSSYLTESIVYPNAKRVAGATLAMPTNSLTAAEAARIVAYIEALSDVTPVHRP
ncbi:unannotated protein [freshwater metagenome]|uniref:Unannotated protein n=1 Tax=freshwater metagenome TaxID=449393 RepID=A0A6J7EIT3_9ZZZZ|nr:c-type cytochrome [Actinomycetota bacterium]